MLLDIIFVTNKVNCVIIIIYKKNVSVVSLPVNWNLPLPVHRNHRWSFYGLYLLIRSSLITGIFTHTLKGLGERQETL
ncbi:hypothetical protein Hanom_Chr06g00502571 [Helianthus anomalus]